MKFKQLFIFASFMAIFSCNIEPIEIANSEQDPDQEVPEINETKRLKEAIGLLNNVEVAKQSFEYLDDKLLSIKVYNKSGNEWIEIVSFSFSYNGNKVIESYDGGRVEYIVENDKLVSVNYFEDNSDLDTGYSLSFTDNKLNYYTFFEGTFSEGRWNYKSNLIYENNTPITLDNELNTPTEPNFTPESKTTFSLNEKNEISGWIIDYSIASPEDEEYNENIEYEFLNKNISKTIEKKWEMNTTTWNVVTEINYTYDEEGYLLKQNNIEIGNGDTENHLYDYFQFWDDSSNFNEVRYSYEEGLSNNYILLYPEFLVHKTPNPFVKFYN